MIPGKTLTYHVSRITTKSLISNLRPHGNRLTSCYNPCIAMTKRIALIIHNQTYAEPKLAQLKLPAADAAALAELLRDPIVGNFDEVELAVNSPAVELRQRVTGLFQRKHRHDELLLYIVGHLLVDEAGQVHLATVDTHLDTLAETALSAGYLTDCMDRSFSRRQMLLLDGGCLRLNSIEWAADMRPTTVFKGRGYGRVVLTSVTGNDSMDEGQETDLTHHLIQALQTGAADADGDGQVELRELYEYLRQQTRQTSLRIYGKHEHFILARNPYHFIPVQPIKWDLISGAILAPATIIIIGGRADLRTAIGLAGLLLLMYALLYLAPD